MWRLWLWKKVSPYLEKNPSPALLLLLQNMATLTVRFITTPWNSWNWNPTLALRRRFHILNMSTFSIHIAMYQNIQWPKSRNVQVNSKWCRRLAMFSLPSRSLVVGLLALLPDVSSILLLLLSYLPHCCLLTSVFFSFTGIWKWNMLTLILMLTINLCPIAGLPCQAAIPTTQPLSKSHHHHKLLL